MNPSFRHVLTLVTIFASNAALAHPGHELADAGFVAGILHPLLGLDHLLAMLVVGIWAAQLGGAARRLVPASFVGVMALGAALALKGLSPPTVEPGIAVSLLVLGLLVASATRLPVAVAMLVAGVFAAFHGAAHAAELPQSASPLLYASGFLLMTAGLHGLGVMLGSLRPQVALMSGRIIGGVAVASGVAAGLSQVLA